MRLAKIYPILLITALSSALWFAFGSHLVNAATPTPDCGKLRTAIAQTESEAATKLQNWERAAQGWLKDIEELKAKRNKEKIEKEKREQQADDDLRDYGCYRQKRAGKFNPEDNCEDKFRNREKIDDEYEKLKAKVKSYTREYKFVVDLINYYKDGLSKAKRIYSEKCIPKDALDVFDPVPGASEPSDSKTTDKSQPPADPCESDPIWCGKRAVCDRDKINALLGKADALSARKQYGAAKKIYQAVKENYSHCPYVWTRVTDTVNDINETLIDQRISTAIGDCNLNTMKRHLAVLLNRSKRTPFISQLINRINLAIERCRANPDGRNPSGSSGPTATWIDETGIGSRGPRSDSGTGGGLLPPGATCAVAYAYAPGGGAKMGNAGPSCSGDCSPLMGWKLPDGARCGPSQGNTGPKTTNQCPPGQHWSRDLQRCHSSG